MNRVKVSQRGGLRGGGSSEGRGAGPGAPAVLGLGCVEAAGGLVVAALFYAPWALGSIPPGAKTGLEVLLGAAAVLWLAGRALGRSWPRVALPAAGAVVFLLVQGWWMTLNAHSNYDAGAGDFAAHAAWWAAGPSTVAGHTSRWSMCQATAILAGFVIVADLGRRRRWRGLVWAGVVAAGCSVIAFGLIQRAGFTDAALRHMPVHEGTPFATYNYHGNAGAFINLVLPAAFGLAVVSLGRAGGRGVASRGEGGGNGGGGEGRGSWLGLAPFVLVAICLAGAVVNVSRAGMTLAAVLTLVLTAWAVRRRMRGRGSRFAELPRSGKGGYRGRSGGARRRAWPRAALIAAAGLAVLLLAGATAAESAGGRWARLPGQLSSKNPRVLAWRIEAPMAARAGWWGYGPGSFKALFPHQAALHPAIYRNWIVQRHTPGTRVSMWSQAHEDYLQTIIEWGWLGAAAWGLLLLGGLARVIRSYRSTPPMGRSPDRALLFCVGVAIVGVAVYALIDFPLQVASLEFYTAVYLGLAWSSDRWEGDDPRAAADRREVGRRR